MKKATLFGALAGAMFIGNAMAADITIYYSPTCPHCHHAREFISQNLIYEYPNLNVTTVNVMDAANRDEFMATLKKCEYESGGVPVMVVGEKCFQGYGDSMGDSIRAAIEVDMDDAAKTVAAENKKAMESDAAAFRDAHAVIGRLVLYCVKDNKGLLDLSLEELQSFSDLFEEDIFVACSMRACVTLRDVPGGPAPNRVRETIEAGEQFLKEFAV